MSGVSTGTPRSGRAPGDTACQQCVTAPRTSLSKEDDRA